MEVGGEILSADTGLRVRAVVGPGLAVLDIPAELLALHRVRDVGKDVQDLGRNYETTFHIFCIIQKRFSVSRFKRILSAPVVPSLVGVGAAGADSELSAVRRAAETGQEEQEGRGEDQHP